MNDKKDLVNFSIRGCKSDSEILAKLLEYEDICESRLKSLPAVTNEVHNKEISTINDWKDLTVDDDSLCELIGLSGKYQKNDPCFLVLKHKFVSELMRDPSFKKNRFYHFFHRLKKEWRKCLRMNGEEIFEVFDIAGCDTKAIAKLAEKEAKTPEEKRELAEFQRDVVSDYVRKFAGTNKRTGKCFARIKLAWKIYLFGDYDRSWFDNLSKRNEKNALRMIDSLMKEKYPSIRNYIIEHKDIWFDMMGLETECISKGVCKDLLDMGIPSVTCHDAVYIKKSDGELLKQKGISVEELFYNHLNLQFLTSDKIMRFSLLENTEELEVKQNG